jgi:hypothetical protein
LIRAIGVAALEQRLEGFLAQHQLGRDPQALAFGLADGTQLLEKPAASIGSGSGKGAAIVRRAGWRRA